MRARRMPRRRACPLPRSCRRVRRRRRRRRGGGESAVVAAAVVGHDEVGGLYLLQESADRLGRVVASSRAGITAAVLSATRCVLASARGRERPWPTLVPYSPRRPRHGRALDDRRASGGFVGVRDRGMPEFLKRAISVRPARRGSAAITRTPPSSQTSIISAWASRSALASTGRRRRGSRRRRRRLPARASPRSPPVKPRISRAKSGISLLQGRHRLREVGLEERDLRRTRGF